MHRVVVVGSGRFAREHVQALAASGRFTVSAVVGSDLPRARSVAALADGAQGTTDLAEVLPDADGVVVVNATDRHAQAVVTAARAGKPVLCDKPVCLTLDELTRVERAVAEGGASLLVGQTVRFQPSVRALAEQIGAGAIGDPRYAHITWYTGHVWPGGWRGWQHDVARSGGHPVHNGVHAFDAAVHLLGKMPTRVFCRPQPTWSSEMPVPDGFHALVRFGDEALAVVELSYALRQPGAMLRRWVVGGERGTLSHDTTDEQEVWSAQAAVSPASIDGALAAELDHWADVIEGRAEPVTTPAQVRAALATGIASQRSLVSGRPEEVEL